jgi:hypothetical protein
MGQQALTAPGLPPAPKPPFGSPERRRVTCPVESATATTASPDGPRRYCSAVYAPIVAFVVAATVSGSAPEAA